LYKPAKGWEVAMQMIGFIALFVASVAAVTALAVSLYAALPKAALLYAERHGRFQGLAREGLADGTREGAPPAAHLVRTAEAAG
jgi:hypothetical protein